MKKRNLNLRLFGVIPIMFFTILALVSLTHLAFATDDLCTPDLVNDSWTDWNDISCSVMDTMDQSRSTVQYDLNDCNLTTNQTLFEYRSEQPCDFCTPDISQVDMSCGVDDTFTSSYRDNNGCYGQTGLESDKVPDDVINSCDYCTPSWLTDNTLCGKDDTFVQYFYDALGCYTQTGLSSDLLGKGEDVRFTCDYCTPNWTETLGICMPDDSWVIGHEDINGCHSKTDLPSDIKDKPMDKIFSLSCDYNNEGFIGNRSYSTTPLTNWNNSAYINQFCTRTGYGPVPSWASSGGIPVRPPSYSTWNKNGTLYMPCGRYSCAGDTIKIQEDKRTWGTTDGWLYLPSNGNPRIIDMQNSTFSYKCLFGCIENKDMARCNSWEDRILNLTKCGDGICDGKESCSSCSTDCGACPIPVVVRNYTNWNNSAYVSQFCTNSKYGVAPSWASLGGIPIRPPSYSTWNKNGTLYTPCGRYYCDGNTIKIREDKRTWGTTDGWLYLPSNGNPRIVDMQNSTFSYECSTGCIEEGNSVRCL